MSVGVPSFGGLPPIAGTLSAIGGWALVTALCAVAAWAAYRVCSLVWSKVGFFVFFFFFQALSLSLPLSRSPSLSVSLSVPAPMPPSCSFRLELVEVL